MNSYRKQHRRSLLLFTFLFTAALAFSAQCILGIYIGGGSQVEMSLGDSAGALSDGEAGMAPMGSVADTGEAGEASAGAAAEGSTGAAGPAEPLSDEEKLAYILENQGQYTADLVEFAQEYPEAVDYVYRYPEMYGMETEIDLSAAASAGSVPLLIQWDDRWGYLDYGGGLVGCRGCGPTCLSMAALYLTGNAAYTPAYIAAWAEGNGYYVEGEGTSWDLMETGCSAFGLSSWKMAVDEASLSGALAEGDVVICSMSEGDFTSGGHFIVLAAYADGAFTVNDPNSPENSSRTWTYDELSWQIRCAWAFRAA